MNRPLYVWRLSSGEWAWICRGCAGPARFRDFRLLAVNTARLHYRHCEKAQAWSAPPERVP